MLLGARITGWALFLLGMGVFLVNGSIKAFNAAEPAERVLAWVAMGMMLTGMILTAVSNLMGHFANRKRMAEELAMRNPFRKDVDSGPPPL